MNMMVNLQTKKFEVDFVVPIVATDLGYGFS